MDMYRPYSKSTGGTQTSPVVATFELFMSTDTLPRDLRPRLVGDDEIPASSFTPPPPAIPSVSRVLSKLHPLEVDDFGPSSAVSGSFRSLFLLADVLPSKLRNILLSFTVNFI